MRQLLVWVWLAIFTHAAAADSALKPFVTGNDSQGWEAVGRLDFNGRSFCTGTMISDTLVLTAAHCLFDIKTGRQHKPRQITFKAGWRNDYAKAIRTARAVYLHPGFSNTSGKPRDRLVNDIALIELDLPVRDGRIAPFATAARPEVGQTVGVVSYAHDRASTPSLQEACSVIARQGGVLVTTCVVDFGSSGAPIFDMSGPRPRITSVVSAKARYQGQPVAVVTALDGALQQILATSEIDSSVFENAYIDLDLDQIEYVQGQ